VHGGGRCAGHDRRRENATTGLPSACIEEIQILSELSRRLIARGRLRLRAAVDDSLERFRQRWIERTKRRERLLDAGHQLGDGTLRARAAAGPEDHVEEHQAERVDVSAVIDRLRHRLFRRHVFERADDRPGHRGAAAGHRARDPEIHDDGLVILVDHDVRGFQIPVDDSGLVRCHEPTDDLFRDRHRPRH
jgi:hypothetical protein